MKKIRKSKRDQQESFFGWLMCSPVLLLLLVFVILPLVLGSYWSMTNKRLISPLPTEYVGLDNYKRVLSLKVILIQPQLNAAGQFETNETGQVLYPRVRDIIRSNSEYHSFRPYKEFDIFGNHYGLIAKDPEFYTSLVNTTLYVVIIVPLILVISLLLAVLVNQKIFGISFFRTVYFIPSITMISVTSVVWIFLFNPSVGLINLILRTVSFGYLGSSQWLQSTDTALFSIILYTIWQASGLFMVIFLGGLQDIPQDIYEAAQIDGANPFQTLIHITIPKLRNTIIYVVITSSILGFRLFTQVDVMTKGGPQNSTLTLILHIVNEGFRNQKIGYASAISIVFFLFVLALTFIQRSLMKSESEME